LDSASRTGPLHGAARIRGAGEMWAIHKDHRSARPSRSAAVRRRWRGGRAHVRAGRDSI